MCVQGARFRRHADIDELAETRILSAISSDIVEHIHRTMKNNKQIRGSQKLRKPERCTAVAIASEITHKRYTYVPAHVDSYGGRSSETLDASAFSKPPPWHHTA